MKTTMLANCRCPHCESYLLLGIEINAGTTWGCCRECGKAWSLESLLKPDPVESAVETTQN